MRQECRNAKTHEALRHPYDYEQTTEFSSNGDWLFASPSKIGRLPYSYTGFWRELDRASKVAGLGHFGTAAFAR